MFDLATIASGGDDHARQPGRRRTTTPGSPPPQDHRARQPAVGSDAAERYRYTAMATGNEPTPHEPSAQRTPSPRSHAPEALPPRRPPGGATLSEQPTEGDRQPKSAQPRRSPANRILGAIVAAGIALALLAWTGLLLHTLPHDDTPNEPDVVVVLGGAGAERAELGIELSERYDVPLVLSSSASHFGEQQGRTCGEDAICFDPVPENTAGEAENMARMAASEGWHEVVVATSAFHTSRSRLLFQQCLGEDRVSVVGATRPDRAAISPRLLVRESAGIVAGATFARAC